MGVELEDPQLRDGGSQHLDDRQRRCVVAAQHDGEEPRPPEACDLRAGSIEPCAR